MKNFLKHTSVSEKKIAEKVFSGNRISNEDAVFLFENTGIDFCGYLANFIREKKHGKKVYYNRNIHVEITNICENRCSFCSFYRTENSEGAWNFSIQDVADFIKSKKPEELTEVHIVGAINSGKDLEFYVSLFKLIKKLYSHLHIKALTAVEIEFLSRLSGLDTKDIISKLKHAGLDSIAGGGAEILDDKIRKKICPQKTDSDTWLRIHREAHKQNIQSNCTILYGHIESYEDRVNHMHKLRELQDYTGGFNCFIPLKYKSSDNELSISSETSLAEDLKNYSVSRIYFDNISHIKAYWPMSGKDSAFLSLNFGVDDIDGTIQDSTKIYSMAGSIEQKPVMLLPELINRCFKAGYIPTERDSLYRIKQ